ncbi:MAG: hypothetical protein R3A11_00370 [Bdellovibrionota bacterium]
MNPNVKKITMGTTAIVFVLICGISASKDKIVSVSVTAPSKQEQEREKTIFMEKIEQSSSPEEFSKKETQGSNQERAALISLINSTPSRMVCSLVNAEGEKVSTTTRRWLWLLSHTTTHTETEKYLTCLSLENNEIFQGSLKDMTTWSNAML